MTARDQRVFRFVENLVPQFSVENLRESFKILCSVTPNIQEAGIALGDHSENAPSVSDGIYACLPFEALLVNLLPYMEEVTKKQLLPVYSYTRIYHQGAELRKHTDRPGCEYSISLCLGGEYEKPWPLWFQDGDDAPFSVEMKEGDAVIYEGVDVSHWREKFEGKSQFQAFLHYVDANGPHKHRVFDGRPALALPRTTSFFLMGD